MTLKPTRITTELDLLDKNDPKFKDTLKADGKVYKVIVPNPNTPPTDVWLDDGQ